MDGQGWTWWSQGRMYKEIIIIIMKFQIRIYLVLLNNEDPEVLGYKTLRLKRHSNLLQKEYGTRSLSAYDLHVWRPLK